MALTALSPGWFISSVTHLLPSLRRSQGPSLQPEAQRLAPGRCTRDGNCGDDRLCRIFQERRAPGPACSLRPTHACLDRQHILRLFYLWVLDFGSHLLPRNESEVEVWEGFPALRLQLRAPLLLAAAASQPGKHQAFDSLSHWQAMLPPGRASAQCGCEIVSKASSLSVFLHPLPEASRDQAGSSCKETASPALFGPLRAVGHQCWTAADLGGARGWLPGGCASHPLGRGQMKL